ncbi:MAG: hypothetical protein WBQ89_27865 [Candidatus Acidiferrum sp.]
MRYRAGFEGFLTARELDVPTPQESAPKAGPMSKIMLAALAVLAVPFSAQTGSAQIPREPRADNPSPSSASRCSETPGGNGLRFLCATPAFLPQDDEEDEGVSAAEAVRIVLRLPEGTALRIAIDERTRISRVGEAVEGHVVDTVYAFDEPVIPSGTLAKGRVTQIAPVPKLQRVEAYANGNFTPFHQYQVTFDRLILSDGRELAIETTVSRGAAEVVHLVSKAQNSTKQGMKSPRAARRGLRPQPNKT